LVCYNFRFVNLIYLQRNYGLMKKLLLVLLLLSSLYSTSQNRFGQFAVTTGPSYSLFRGIHKIPFTDYDKNFKFTIGGQLHADWALLRRVSLGFGVCFQRHQLNIQDYSYELDGITYQESPTQTIDVSGYYVRGLIHILSVYDDTDEAVDLYWGVQQYQILYQTRNNSLDPDFPTTDIEARLIPGVVAGVRYYPTSWFGFHSEFAIPGPYFISMGLAFRLAGRDRFFDLN
jgi:hypothetical protein